MPHAHRHRSCGLIVLSFMLIAPLLLAQGATVSGTIAVDATKIVPKVASAVTYTAPNGRLISVLLSDKPANPKEFAEMTKVGPTEPLVSGIIEGAWKSFHLEKQLSGFVFTIG